VPDSIVEVVVFKQSGLVDLKSSVKALAAEVDKSTDRLKKMQAVAESPVLGKWAARMESVNKQHEVANARLRNISLAHRLADGSAARQLRTMTQLNNTYTQMQKRLELTARWGERLGGFLHQHGEGFRFAGGALGVAASAGVGLARSGFSGTVEAARLDSETRQLSRELAAVMKPTIELLTRGARGIRKELERFDENGQDVVQGGLLAGGTGLAAIAARSYLGGGAFGARALGAARFGLLAPAAYMAYRTVNPTTPEAGDPRVRGLMERRPEYSGMTPGQLRLEAMKARENEFGGLNWAQRRLGSIGHEVSGWLGFTEKRDDWRPLSDQLTARADALEGVKNGRRSVQLAGGGFEDGTASYDRLSAAIEKVEGERGNERAASEEGSLVAAIRDMIPHLATLAEKTSREGGPSLPRPGGGS
jgi:hypothetical protein